MQLVRQRDAEGQNVDGSTYGKALTPVEEIKHRSIQRKEKIRLISA